MSHSTVITFPSGSLVASARVVGVHPAEGGAVVVLDRTPFHPVDHTWPDQPGIGVRCGWTMPRSP